MPQVVFISNRKTGVKIILKNKKIQDIAILNKKNYHLQKQSFSKHEY